MRNRYGSSRASGLFPTRARLAPAQLRTWAPVSAGSTYVGASGVVYRVVEDLLPGGFGSVSRVESDDGAQFALKTLHVELDDPDALEHEADSLQRVRHENVISYVDFGREPEPFMVMELARDGSLASRLQSAQQAGSHFTFETIFSWADQALRGLSAIHELLVHRDLKPDNILFIDEDLKIGDFGIARLVDASTRQHTFKGWGTPRYMPPEGWAGVGGPSPAPSYDLYSLGVVLYELIALRPAFEGDRTQLERAHLYEVPPALRQLRPAAPPQLEAIVLRLLRKDPADRGGTAEEIRQALIAARSSALTDVVLEADIASESPALERLRQGVSAMVQRQSAAEAARLAEAERLRQRRERFEAGRALLERMIEEALIVIRANVAPLVLDERRDGPGVWTFELPPGERSLAIFIRETDGSDFEGGRAPGEVLGFGAVRLDFPADHGDQMHSRASAGANLVMYVSEDTPWVPKLHIIEVRNNPVIAPVMRDVEPFHLEPHELPDHARWLWGGPVHVFQTRVEELQPTHLINWLGELGG
jgi:serine/threonine protein kinase